ncbi:MAG: PilZ domain-containing protein [Pseudomonadota bacterium]
MDNKRKQLRRPLQMNAILWQDNNDQSGYCSLMDVSPEGIGILYNTREAINAGATIRLFIDTIPDITEAAGTVIWTKQLGQSTGFNCAAGVQVTGTKHKDKAGLFEYALSQAYRYEKQWAEEKKLNYLHVPARGTQEDQ